jgi:hypothetical protein
VPRASGMLTAHLDAIEQRILCSSRIPGNSGHPIHKGTPREAFIREFLLGHLGTRAAIGTGEIIDADSRAGKPRNQIDIVIYKSEFPKIDLGGGLHAFLSESVIATIEVKSNLTKSRLERAVNSSISVKGLQRSIATHVSATKRPQGIVSFVVSYDGPSNARTVFDWLVDIDKKHGINSSPLPPIGELRSAQQSQGLEGVFVLGRNSLVFDYDAVGVITDPNRRHYPNAKYQFRNAETGNLLWLFLLLTHAVSNAEGQWPILDRYLSEHNFEGVEFEPK